MQVDGANQAGFIARGRIGVARRVHAIERSSPIGGGEHYGTSRCGKWAGLCRPTKDPVTCWECKKAIADWASRLAGDLVKAGEAEYGR